MGNFSIEQASTFADDIDLVILVITIIVGIWWVATESLFLGFILKFRESKVERAMYITGEKKEHMKWINLPHGLVLACDVIVIVFAVRVWYNVKQDLPEPDRVVRITGQQWTWSFQHPGPDNRLDTEDDIRTVDDLYIELGKTYHFELVAKDVMHSFSVPAFRLKQDLVPGRTIKGWFQTTMTGDFDLQCAEMCGIGHGIMAAKVHVIDSPDYAKWVADNSEHPEHP